ncbi:MAG: tetratricopeptide repeat protein [Candidatus Nitrosotenuis sp.]
MNADEIFQNGTIEFNLGNFKKALMFFDKTLELRPTHIGALIKKGNILGKFGKYANAISCYDKALNIEPQNILALINKGLALHYLQRYDEAIACYDAVLQQKPANTIALYNKASSLVRQNKIKDGLEILEKTIELDFSFKYKARFDIDFEGIQRDNDFKRLIL